MSLGRSEDAVAALESEIQMAPKAAESHYLLGQAHLQLKRYALARRSYEAAMQARPDHRNACYGLSVVCARLGETKRAREYREKFRKLKVSELRELIAENESFDDLTAMRRRLAATHAGAGQVYHEHGHEHEAETHWRRAAALDPRNVACRSLLAAMYQSSRREREALELCEQIREIQPEDATNWLNIGVLNARLERPSAAERAFRKAIELAPRNAQGYRSLALLRVRTRSGLAEARQLAQSAVKLEPSAPNYLLLSRICDENGDRASAVLAMRRVVALEPGNGRYRQMLRALEGRR
jgi:cytochrome c-type biogenesis protein CcmH/NrfG